MPPCWRSLPGGVFAGHQPQVTHQLAGMLEAVEVAQFGHQRGGVEQRHPAQPINARTTGSQRQPGTARSISWS